MVNIANVNKTKKKYTETEHEILFLGLFFVIACQSDIDLSMERGIQYYEWGMIEKALLEFKYVIHSLKSHSNKLNYREIKLLSRAYHNLAVSYAKKQWYTDAEKEAKNAFDLFPTDENRKVLELIQSKKAHTKKNPDSQ